MRYLRTISTRRLLATIAGLVIAIAGGTAIAVAATSGGPVPKPEPLATAIHQAITDKAPAGITADIKFTNNLISSTSIAGITDPLLTGATGRLWLTKGHFRLELQADTGDAQVVADRSGFWVYDPSSNTVYRGSWSALGMHRGRHAAGPHEHAGMPTVADIQKVLNRLAAHIDISPATPTDVAGQAAYRVAVSPKHDGGLLGDVQLAWDAVKGIPLDFSIYAAGNPTPVIELQATGISYGAIDPSSFAVTPPTGAKVVRVATGHAGATPGLPSGRERHGRHVVLRRVVHLPFTLDAPATLGGLTKQSVKELDWGGSPAALVLYGKGLGGIAVIERRLTSSAGHGLPLGAAGSSGGPSSSGGPALHLPTVSIGGATGQELDTSLGSVLSFDRGGLSYTLIGSVPAAAIEAAARDL